MRQISCSNFTTQKACKSFPCGTRGQGRCRWAQKPSRFYGDPPSYHCECDYSSPKVPKEEHIRAQIRLIKRKLRPVLDQWRQATGARKAQLYPLLQRADSRLRALQKQLHKIAGSSLNPSRFDSFDLFDDWDDGDEDSRFDLASRPISPWPSLMRRAIQALQNALQALGPPVNQRAFNNALHHAEALIQRAAQEMRKVTSGNRLNQVMDQLGNALIRIRAARAQASGSSLLPGARSLIDPKVSTRGAIAHIREARQAIGLKLL